MEQKSVRLYDLEQAANTLRRLGLPVPAVLLKKMYRLERLQAQRLKDMYARASDRKKVAVFLRGAYLPASKKHRIPTLSRQEAAALFDTFGDEEKQEG